MIILSVLSLCFCLYAYLTVCIYSFQFTIVLKLLFSNLLFSPSYILSVTLVLGKVGKMKFCFNSKEIFLLEDHTLCCLEDGTQQLFYT